MKPSKTHGVLVATLIILLGLTCTAGASPVLVGSLSTSGSNEIVANYNWSASGTGFKIAWSITPSGSNYNYQYTITNATGGDLGKTLSHVILQVSDAFASGDISNALPASYELRSDATGGKTRWSSADSSNQNMPGAISGIKWDTCLAQITISFTSPKDPVPGNFYVRGGKDSASKQYLTAWNSAFDGSGNATIPVPDTSHAVVPLPTAAWGSIGLLGAVVVSRILRNRRHRD